MSETFMRRGGVGRWAHRSSTLRIKSLNCIANAFREAPVLSRPALHVLASRPIAGLTGERAARILDAAVRSRTGDAMRRTPVWLAALMFMAVAFTAEGQPAASKVPRIAYVYLYELGPSAPFVDDFRKGLKEHGWEEGRNIVVEYRNAKGNPETLAAIMRELVDSKIDLIVGACTPETKAAQQVTKTIPIVFAATGDPVAAGVVASLARPGGNATGYAVQMVELSAKRMALLKEIYPDIKQATALWSPLRPDNAADIKAMQDAAVRLGFTVVSQQIRSREEMDIALDYVVKEKSQALTEVGDTLVSAEARRIVDFANGANLPAIYDSRELVDAGGLISYGPNLPNAHRRAAYYVDKILKGAKPADLPVEQPTKFELVVNLKTAQKLGITIPQSVLLAADEVIR
jgi:putative ABC transport system substrate-binding protein